MRQGFFAELKRRHVYRVAVAYAVVGWVVIQAATSMSPFLHLPDTFTTMVIVVVALGFPVAIILAWAFEMTPEGVRRTEPADSSEARAPEQYRKVGHTLDRIIIGVLVVAVAFMAWRMWAPSNKTSKLSSIAAAASLKTPASASTPAPATTNFPANSIAVLPFTNLSSDKNQNYFSDGISEDLLNLLAKIPQLQVTARTSSFAFKGKEIGIPEIARKLHVSHILEGSVQKAGDEVRITAQLVDARTDTQLWSQTWDRQLKDVFKIQDEISGDVVKALKVKLLGAAPKARTTDPKAYALYLQAKALGQQRIAEALKQSDALYHKALAIDPSYAPAWDGLANNFIYEGNVGVLSYQEGFALARDAANKALSINPDYAPALARLSFIAMYGDNDLAGAARHLQRALALDPTNIDVLRNAAMLLGNLGRQHEALAVFKAIVRRDPVDVTMLYDLGYDQRNTGRYDAAIASFRTALSLSPNLGAAHYQLGVTLLLKGEPKAALAEIEQESSESWRKIGLPLAYCALGRESEADQAFSELIAKQEKESPFNIAYDYAYCGNADKAFEWLDKAVQYKDPGLNEIVGESLLNKIHSDPRWLPFLRKIGYAPEQLAKIQFTVGLSKAWQEEATEASPASSASTK